VGDGRYAATVHADWEIWGPCGGSVAAFAPVDLVVTPLRSGRTALA
jgi:hypothetical protein